MGKQAAKNNKTIMGGKIKISKEPTSLPAMLVIVVWLSLLTLAGMYFLVNGVKSSENKDNVRREQLQRIEKLEKGVKALEDWRKQ